MAAPRARDAQATRDALLRAAVRRFTLFGYDGATTREIAGDAGVNVSLISRYFGSKEGLLEAVLRESASEVSGLRDRRGSLLEDLVASLAPAAAGTAPRQSSLLLFLTNVGEDPRVERLRHEVLGTLLAQLEAELGGADDAGDRRLGAELAVALVAGIQVLRAAMPGEGLRVNADPEVATVVERLVASIPGHLGG